MPALKGRLSIVLGLAAMEKACMAAGLSSSILSPVGFRVRYLLETGKSNSAWRSPTMGGPLPNRDQRLQEAAVVNSDSCTVQIRAIGKAL